jgi:PAS domain S-box-containing protein
MISSEQAINHLLATISLRIRQSLDVSEILQTIVQEVCWLLKCDRVMIYHFEPDWSGKVTVEAVGDPQWSILGSVINDSCFESSWIEQYQQGQVTHNEDIATATISECHRELLASFNVKANLVAPILQPCNIPDVCSDPLLEQTNELATETQLDVAFSHNLQLWGLLMAHQCENPRKWEDTEINLFKQLANQIAIACYQAELLQRTDRELRERKLAERKTLQVQQFLQTVIDRLPVAVYVKSARQENFGKFQLWNKATEQIFTLEAAQVLGKTVYDYFSTEQAQDFLQQDLAVWQTGQAVDIPEEYIRDRDNQTKIVHKVKVPLYDREREPEYLLCIAEDITARKEAEQELRHKSEELTAFSHNLKLLHRLNTTNYQSFNELFRDHLQTGCQMFDCSTGIVGLVQENIYTIYAIESDLEELCPQMQVTLKDTYCGEVVSQRSTVTLIDVGKIPKFNCSPIYQNYKLESYIGTPIYVDREIFGTLCFASPKIREIPFSDREKETIEMMAQSIGRFIFAHQVEQKRQEAEAQITQTKKELEIRVLQRTAELEIANHRLQEELQEREQIQFALQASQDNLRESERRWRSLLENVRLLVVGIDTQGKVDYVNPYFLELTGFSREEVLEQNWFNNFVHPQHKIEAQQIHQNILQVECEADCCHSHHHHQTIILTKAKEAKIIALNSTQLCDFQGIPIGIMCIGEDITERQAIERMKDEFISVVSHELRTPLTSIRGTLGLLATGALDNQPERAARVVQIAAESTEHLVRLVNDILELERLESNKIELVIEKIQLQSLIDRAISRVQLFANKARILIETTKLEGEFWGDGDRLLQVFTNLLSNAIKFSESESQVGLDVRWETTNVIFIVRDRGRGIPADQLENIFERFHQVDASDSRRKGGTGLGLAICRSIVEQHGGKIWVESVYGEGTTFYFSIPNLG